MPEQIQTRLIEEEMKSNYLDYAMSVITARALPDARDGLKPVHRRILFSMHGMNLNNNKPFVKSARIVGDCFKYHPHGDVALYESLVRMAQDFSLRYILVNGHGNFGTQDFSQPAQMRYTEARLSKIGEEMLKDLDKETVDFVPNFDGSLKEPTILPSNFPNLLVNGSSGIAVGMATNIPPHNLTEVSDAIIKTIDNPEISYEELFTIIKGPDFPTGAIILGKSGIKDAYTTGRGKIIVKAKASIEERKIIFTEIPYQLNKSLLLENIASLVNEKRLEGISDLRDESNKEGMRIVVQLKKDADPNVVLNQLYSLTSLKSSFGVIMLALHEGQPKVMNLKEIIGYYIQHRRQVTIRRLNFELKEALDKAHLLEGLIIALSNVDEVVQGIKSSQNVEEARTFLTNKYQLSEVQANAILDMKLQKLTSLETDKIKKEHAELLVLIAELKAILDSNQRIMEIIKKELEELKEKYGDARRTSIEDSEDGEFIREDMIKEEDVVITLTNSGYIKQIPLDTYKQQRRGGKGIIGTETKETDVVENLFVTSNHNSLLFFTNKGKIHWLKAYEVPVASRYAQGKAVVNLLNMEKDEKVKTLLPISQFDANKFLIFATKQGIVKKTSLAEYSNPRKGGIIAINLRDADELIQVALTDGSKELIMGTRNGNAVRFNENDVSVMGRNATGVRGIKLEMNDGVIGLETAIAGTTVLTVTEKGFGKRTPVDDYRLIRRGGSGVINIKVTEKNGKVAAIKTVFDDDEIMLITEKGVIIRVNAKDISVIGRNTQGVTIMRVDNDKVRTVAKIAKE
ncbi:MAG TPA: DNA gyrase subunit A [Candidatus Nanoarchaeia archaeon]|nr:DNA gyrase subunit A [Candidatus Nanoarchaeia archaeon]